MKYNCIFLLGVLLRLTDILEKHYVLFYVLVRKQKLSNLKYLDLSDSLGLTKTPNFGDIPNLETLILKWCKNLEEVHPSLGHCRMLTILHLKGCGKLKKLPKFVSMESLETLNLGECTSLEKFPKICGICGAYRNSM